MEHLGVDAARDHRDARRVRLVEAAQLAELDRARRDDGRRSPDGLTLDLDPNVAFAVDVLVHDLALDEAEGVKHLDRWDLPALLERPRDLRREPVVRVQDVVCPTLLLDLGDELRGELVEMLVHVDLWPVPKRSRRDVDHACVRAERLDARIVFLAPPGEDVDLDAARAEVARELAHVHIHPTGVAAAQLRERARVHRDHRDAADQAR